MGEEIERGAGALDWLKIARDYEQAALGPHKWPGVTTPHYALSGAFKSLGDEIERLRKLLRAPTP